MKKKDGKKLLLRGVVVFLIFIFVGGVALGGRELLLTEGTMVPEEEPAASLTPCPETTQEIVDYLRIMVEKAIRDKPMLESGNSVSFDENSVTLEGVDNPFLINAAKYIDDSAQDIISDKYDFTTSDFGEGFGDKLWMLDFNIAKVISADCTYIYYVCPDCGKEVDTIPDECPDCGGTDLEWKESVKDEYVLELDFADETAPIAEENELSTLFHFRTNDEIYTLISEQCNGYMMLSDMNRSYTGLSVTARINRLTDEIVSLSFNKQILFKTNVIFESDLKSLGTIPCSFKVEDDVNFNFTWPKIEISAKTLVMEKKETEVLTAAITGPKITEDNESDIEIVWSGSNDEIATVDNDGYVNSKKQDGQITVTVTVIFKKLGWTFSDSCEVYVRTPVTGIDISDRNVELSVGQTETLEAKVEPKNATVRDVTWHTTNEAIATVDKNGKVTAVAAGEATVYALSEDGYYKVSCDITVL